MIKLIAFLYLATFVATQGVWDPRCPPTATPVIRLPHETDCSRFYICQFGLKHLMPSCPRGFLFDEKSTFCVEDYLVDCSRTTIGISSTTSKSTTSATSSSSFETSSSIFNPPTVPTVTQTTSKSSSNQSRSNLILS